MKNQWPLWMFVIGVVMIVLFAFNYEGQNEVVSLSEIFPDDEFSDMPQVTYEFIDKEGVATPIQTRSAPPAVVRTTAQTVEVKSPVVAEKPAPKSVQQVKVVPRTPAPQSVPRTAPVAVQPKPVPIQAQATSQASKVKFTIQVASSNNKERAMAALKKVKAKGYDAYLVEKDLGSKGVWYRTYIGKFANKSEAKTHLSKVSRDYPGSFLISPK